MYVCASAVAWVHAWACPNVIYTFYGLSIALYARFSAHFISFLSFFCFSTFVIFLISHFVQAMSALLCCGPCFDPQYLTEDGLIYPWLDTLLISTDDKVRFDPRIFMFLPIQNIWMWKRKLSCPFTFELQVYDLAREIVVLLLESNPDSGHLLEWVIDRCYTAQPREADICFLSLATVFSARYVQNQ